MRAGDLPETAMRLKVMSEHSSVRVVADAFSDTPVGLVVICDDDGGAIGVVSKSDLVRHLARAGRIDVPVTTVMTRAVASASPGDDLRTAWQSMMARRRRTFRCLGQIVVPSERSTSATRCRQSSGSRKTRRTNSSTTSSATATAEGGCHDLPQRSSRTPAARRQEPSPVAGGRPRGNGRHGRHHRRAAARLRAHAARPLLQRRDCRTGRGRAHVWKRRTPRVQRSVPRDDGFDSRARSMPAN